MRFLRPVVVALMAMSASVKAKALRQYHPRSQADDCANVYADLKLYGIVYGKIDHCLCASGIPALIHSNPYARKAVLHGGEAGVTAELNSLIKGSRDYKSCYYPDYAIPHCSSDPCGFTCEHGFKPSPYSKPTACVCEPPYTVCNGVCGKFHHCSSQKPKRDAIWRDRTCPHGWSACGVWGEGDYECVDVTQDLWSCGGCGLPLLPTDPTGTDCTAIPGVHDVSCLSSRCVVQRCRHGFAISSDRTTCVPTRDTSPNVPTFVHDGEWPYNAREA